MIGLSERSKTVVLLGAWRYREDVKLETRRGRERERASESNISLCAMADPKTSMVHDGTENRTRRRADSSHRAANLRKTSGGLSCRVYRPPSPSHSITKILMRLRPPASRIDSGL